MLVPSENVSTDISLQSAMAEMCETYMERIYNIRYSPCSKKTYMKTLIPVLIAHNVQYHVWRDLEMVQYLAKYRAQALLPGFQIFTSINHPSRKRKSSQILIYHCKS